MQQYSPPLWRCADTSPRASQTAADSRSRQTDSWHDYKNVVSCGSGASDWPPRATARRSLSEATRARSSLAWTLADELSGVVRFRGALGGGGGMSSGGLRTIPIGHLTATACDPHRHRLMHRLPLTACESFSCMPCSMLISLAIPRGVWPIGPIVPCPCWHISRC